MLSTFIALVDKANKKDADYGVIFPDFPGCVAAGVTLEKALQNAREGLIFHIEGMIESKVVVPKPSTLDDIAVEIEKSDAIIALIRIVIPTGELKRINITMDEGLIAEVDHAAKLAGKNRSQFLAEAVREKLA